MSLYYLLQEFSRYTKKHNNCQARGKVEVVTGAEVEAKVEAGMDVPVALSLHVVVMGSTLLLPISMSMLTLFLSIGSAKIEGPSPVKVGRCARCSIIGLAASLIIPISTMWITSIL